jgi:hypothetical protein
MLNNMLHVFYVQLTKSKCIYKRQRILHKDYDRKGSVEKKNLVVSLKVIGAKTNWLAVKQRS